MIKVVARCHKEGQYVGRLKPSTSRPFGWIPPPPPGARVRGRRKRGSRERQRPNERLLMRCLAAASATRAAGPKLDRSRHIDHCTGRARVDAAGPVEATGSADR